MMESPPSFLTESLNSAISFLVHIEAGVTESVSESCVKNCFIYFSSRFVEPQKVLKPSKNV